MDIERVFMSCYKIEEQPDDIFNLIELALRVGAFKYQPQFEKRKARIIKFLMNPSITSTDDDEEEEEEEEEEEVIEDNVDDQDDVISVEEPEKEEADGLGTQQITAESNKPLVTKIRIVIRKSVQVAAAEKQNNCNAITESSTELKKTDLVQQLDKQGTPQSHNTTTMASRKRMNESTKRVQVALPRVRLLSDLSFEKHLDRDKQSHKGFKKMECDHDTKKKREEGAQQTQRTRKECTTGLTKMNVATKPVQVVKSMQKGTQSINDMKKKFESSKRKFEERLAEQREAKRRIIMVDFHDMPKLANDDSRAPRRRCWG
ncbi:hypothetical protein H5410_012650 [Solanum commersonii]|uniref:Uncharacterized protein n=1 Tax=Solanum commersonii TaxID=4109 RepID=A0A9J6AS57_SOLCO|nr:hypothetical protein H5410_012650 [Solanum commersonii]